jgi:hypothetical protein
MSEGRWNKLGSWGSSDNSIPGDVETELFPSLRPGQYVLEVSRGVKPNSTSRSFLVTIRRGQTVDLDVGTAR